MQPDQALSAKTIVVTGATSGIGRATATALAVRGAHVIGVGRSAQRCAETHQAIQATVPEARLAFFIADLSSQRHIRSLATRIREYVASAAGGQIDVLVNNAAGVSSWYTTTEDGYELQFALNHLAPFLLTHELIDLLRESPAARVITVSSGSHHHTKIHWSDVMYRRHYNCLQAYKQSKLANVMFTIELNRRFAGTSALRAYAVDPGLVNTSLGLKGTGGLVHWIWNKRRAQGVSPEQGAATIVFLASEPEIADPQAAYWKDCRPAQSSPAAQSPEEAARLWALSERLCGIAWDQPAYGMATPDPKLVYV